MNTIMLKLAVLCVIVAVFAAAAETRQPQPLATSKGNRLPTLKLRVSAS
jgi:hypothetical protein